jgi:hypothetical protein
LKKNQDAINPYRFFNRDHFCGLKYWKQLQFPQLLGSGICKTTRPIAIEKTGRLLQPQGQMAKHDRNQVLSIELVHLIRIRIMKLLTHFQRDLHQFC